MNIINKIRNLFKSKDQPPAISDIMTIGDYLKNNVLSLDQIFENAGYNKSKQDLTQPALNHSLINKCVGVYSERLPMVPLKFMNMRTDEEVFEYNNEAVDFLYNKTGYTLFDFLSMTIAYYVLYGESFWYIIDSVGKQMGLSSRPGGIQVIDPTTMTENINQDGTLVTWNYKSTNNGRSFEKNIPAASIIQMKTSNVYNQYRGISVLPSLLNKLNIDYKSFLTLLNFYDNAGIPGAIIFADKDARITKENMQQAVREYDAKAKGVSKSGSTIGLAGGLDIKTIALSQDKSLIHETQTQIRNDVLAAMNVPLTYAGYTEGINRATADAQERNFWQGCLSMMKKIEYLINNRILRTIDPSIYCKFDTGTIESLRPDFNLTVDAAVKLHGMGWTRNELAEGLNIDLPSDDPTGDIRYIPMGLMPVEEGYEYKEEPADTVDIVKADIEDTFSTNNEDNVRKARRSFNILQRKEENQFSSKLRSYFLGERMKVLKVIGKVENSLSKSQMYMLFEELGNLFETENVRLKTVVAPVIESAAATGHVYARRLLGVNPRDFILNQQSINERINKVVGINNTTFKQIKGQVLAGINSGETIGDIADRVKGVYSFARKRSVVIARTESSFMMSHSTMEEYKQAGLEKHIWLTSNDSSVRDEHIDNGNAGPVIVGNPFPSGETFPGEATISCRCCLAPYFSGDK